MNKINSKLTKFLLKYYFRVPEKHVMALGNEVQKESIFAVVNTSELWHKLPNRQKLLCLFRLRWTPRQDEIESAAKQVLRDEIFGEEDDLGNHLLNLAIWHHYRKWDLKDLTGGDQEKIDGINAYTALTRKRFRYVNYSVTPLRLREKSPHACFLIFVMPVKVPVWSIRYFLDMHHAFIFQSIRKAKHPHADALIAFLYEIALIQQKIAIALYESIEFTVHARERKKSNLLIEAEVDANREIDSVITNLKASIEKIVSFLGVVHEMANLADKKTHAAKLNALRKGLPPLVTEQPYWALIENFISPENLEVLNDFRTGLLHKKGVSNLQPHQYVGKPHKETAFMEIFATLHDQYARNAAVFLCALAILTDKLCVLDPPTQPDVEGLFEISGEALKSLFKDE